MNHHDAVCEAVLAESPCRICLQEKKVVFSDFDVMQLLGAGFDYVYLSAMQKLGGGGEFWSHGVLHRGWSLAAPCTVTRCRLGYVR
jgi:hypothetical protein